MTRHVACFEISVSLLVLWGCADQPLDPSVPGSGQGPLPSTVTTVAAPDNLTASGISESQIALTWRDNSTNESRFEVFRAPAGYDADYALIASPAADVVQYSDGKLSLGYRFCYKVRTARTLGSRTVYSAFSSPACAQPLPPPAPSEAAAAVASPSSIAVTWQDNSSTETRFWILRALNPEQGAWTWLASVPANVRSFSDGSVVPDTRYCYEIKAERDDTLPYRGGIVTASSTVSNVSCVTIPASAPPPSAYVVSVRPEGSTVVRTMVTWTDAAAKAPPFRLYRSTDDGGTWNLVADLAANSSYLDRNLISEQRACYRVVAYNTAGGAPPSTAACTTPAAAPTNLAGIPAQGQIDLTWSDHSAVEDGYRVFLTEFITDPYCAPWFDGTNYDVTWTLATLPPNATAFRATLPESDPCDPAAEFRYTVIATKDGGVSDPSNQVSVAPISLTP